MKAKTDGQPQQMEEETQDILKVCKYIHFSYWVMIHMTGAKCM